jgi:hypothetical protein
MSSDFILVLGLFASLISVPLIANAILHDGSPSRFSLLMSLLALVLLFTAFFLKPGGYALSEIIPAVRSVLGV